jgi:hypothetical protein
MFYRAVVSKNGNKSRKTRSEKKRKPDKNRGKNVAGREG